MSNVEITTDHINHLVPIIITKIIDLWFHLYGFTDLYHIIQKTLITSYKTNYLVPYRFHHLQSSMK